MNANCINQLNRLTESEDYWHLSIGRRITGEKNGNPLQYSCLGNPMEREAWWATLQGVAKSQTRLKRLSTHTELFFIKTTHVLGGMVIEEDGKSLVCLQGDYAWQLVTQHNFLLAILGLEMNLLLLKCLLCLPYPRKVAPERSLLIGSGIGLISLDFSESSMRGWS